MWMKTSPNSNQDPTTHCNTCVLFLQEQQRQKEEMRKSNMSHIVVLSARAGEQKDSQLTSKDKEHQGKKMYAYKCPTCKTVLQSSVHTGNVQVKHKGPDGRDCSRQFHVSCGEICAAYSYCFDHAKCPKHSPDSYGVSRSNRPEIVVCKKCEKQFRVPKNAISWKSTCPKGCRKQDAVQE